MNTASRAARRAMQHLARPLSVAATHVDATPQEAWAWRADAFGQASASLPAWQEASAAAPSAPVPQQGEGVTLSCVAARPHFVAGSRIAAHFDGGIASPAGGDAGTLRLCISPPMRVPVRAGVEAHIDTLGWDASGGAQMRGWLRVHGVAVASLGLVPSRLWSDGRPAATLLQEVWQTLVAPPVDPRFCAPRGLHVDGVAHDGRLELQVRAVWQDAADVACVTQHLWLDGAGDATGVAGALTYTGALASLSRFVDTQLLPFVGEAPRPPKLAEAATDSSDATAVQAYAAWRSGVAGGKGFAAKASIAHPLWDMRAALGEHEDARQFAVDFAGHPARVLAAVRDIHLPRLCRIAHLAPHIDAAGTYARAWTLSRHAWEGARATLQLRGDCAAETGLTGTLALQLHHGRWIDAFEAGLGPQNMLPRRRRAPSHLIDEAGPLALPDTHPDGAVCGLTQSARFLTGGQAAWSPETLRALGAAPEQYDMWFKMRRYGASTAALLPLGAARSVWSTWKAAMLGENTAAARSSLWLNISA